MHDFPMIITRHSFRLLGVSAKSCKILFLGGTYYSLVPTLAVGCIICNCLATMHSITDRQTDRQTTLSCHINDIISMQYGQLKMHHQQNTFSPTFHSPLSNSLSFPGWWSPCLNKTQHNYSVLTVLLQCWGMAEILLGPLQLGLCCLEFLLQFCQPDSVPLFRLCYQLYKPIQCNW